MDTNTQLSFQYADPQDGSPLFITVRYDGVSYQLENSNDNPTIVPLKITPPVADGILSVIFRDDYYPLPLYCDGTTVWLPALNGPADLPVLTPFPLRGKNNIKISPINPDHALIQFIITITDVITGNGPGIGIMIVGTAGLGDGNPEGERSGR